ncbi:carbohydrate ABC transporter permease [Paenibacillus sp. OAS669]|uniref:carbohydrate ABC transporter permease n=1 Tax=Paenibacillus sp. OAS669 TaxID=2663821 RepID=UPI00178A84E9|nr:carbohydrate ABC transporter permease [Paenibacillus sp. OAS669]MBE1442996.1 multiple sugar transport system permease protein [Paenibacillus sp. OAS669]
MNEYAGSRRLTVGKVALYAVGYALAIAIAFPVIWMIVTSFKPQGSLVADISQRFSPPFSIENYVYIFENAPVLKWTMNSVIVSCIIPVASLTLGSLAAFALSRIDFSYRKAAFWIILGGMMIPGEATIISLYIVTNGLNLLDTYFALILPSLAGPLGVLVMKQFFDGIPDELVDAAKIDGCSMFRIWWNMFLPLSKPVLASLMIFSFLGSWNDFLWPFLSITSEELMTLPVGIPFFNSSYTQDETLPMTINAYASIPIIIVFIIFQKYIVKGITLSGIKG